MTLKSSFLQLHTITWRQKTRYCLSDVIIDSRFLWTHLWSTSVLEYNTREEKAIFYDSLSVKCLLLRDSASAAARSGYRWAALAAGREKEDSFYCWLLGWRKVLCTTRVHFYKMISGHLDVVSCKPVLEKVRCNYTWLLTYNNTVVPVQWHATSILIVFLVRIWSFWSTQNMHLPFV